MLERVRGTIERYALIPEGSGVVVGLSGGADSVALLDVLLRLASGLRFRVYAAHLNHGIREFGAEHDEMFVRNLCESFGVPLIAERIDVPARAGAEGLSLETAARLERYAFLERARVSFGADLIAVAHHMDDNAESILLHLIRGSGLTGLIGMAPRRDLIIRPLLFVRRYEIENYLFEREIAYCTDETNLITEGSRNHLRLKVIPYIEQNINKRVIEAFCRSAELLYEDEKYLCGEAERALDSARSGGGYNRDALRVLPPAVKSRAIRLALKKVGAEVDIEKVHIDSVVRLLESRTGAMLNLPHAFVRNSYDLIVFEHADDAGVLSSFMGDCFLSIEHIDDHYTAYKRTPYGDFAISAIKPTEMGAFDRYTAYLDADKLSFPVELRLRREGDRFHPVNAPGGGKLKSYLIDHKVDRLKRDRLALAACGSDIIFIPGFCVAHEVRVTRDTRRVLMIQYVENNSNQIIESED